MTRSRKECPKIPFVFYRKIFFTSECDTRSLAPRLQLLGIFASPSLEEGGERQEGETKEVCGP
jgi:hypothetical protein